MEYIMLSAGIIMAAALLLVVWVITESAERIAILAVLTVSGGAVYADYHGVPDYVVFVQPAVRTYCEQKAQHALARPMALPGTKTVVFEKCVAELDPEWKTRRVRDDVYSSAETSPTTTAMLREPTVPAVEFLTMPSLASGNQAR